MSGKTSELGLARKGAMSARASDTARNASGRRKRAGTPTKRRKRTYRNATRMLETAIAICAASASLLALAMAGIAGSLEVGNLGTTDFALKAVVIAVPLIVLGTIIARLDKTLNQIKEDRRRR